jgi:hypothetical protein
MIKRMENLMKSLFESRFIFCVALVVLAAFTRLLPHPYNFSPIDGLAIFSGAMLWKKPSLSFLVPIAALMVGDLFLGLHSTIFFVYGSVALMVILGRSLGSTPSTRAIFGTSVLSSCLFFVITNFGMWLTTPLYSKDVFGLAESYIAGLPFFHWTLLGDLFFSFTLFGAVRGVEKIAQEL